MPPTISGPVGVAGSGMPGPPPTKWAGRPLGCGGATPISLPCWAPIFRRGRARALFATRGRNTSKLVGDHDSLWGRREGRKRCTFRSEHYSWGTNGEFTSGKWLETLEFRPNSHQKNNLPKFTSPLLLPSLCSQIDLPLPSLVPSLLESFLSFSSSSSLETEILAFSLPNRTSSFSSFRSFLFFHSVHSLSGSPNSLYGLEPKGIFKTPKF